MISTHRTLLLERYAGGPGSGVKGHTTARKPGIQKVRRGSLPEHHVSAADAHRHAEMLHRQVMEGKLTPQEAVAASHAAHEASTAAGKGSYGSSQAAVTLAKDAANPENKDKMSDIPGMTRQHMYSHDAAAYHNQMVRVHNQAVVNLKKKAAKASGEKKVGQFSEAEKARNYEIMHGRPPKSKK